MTRDRRTLGDEDGTTLVEVLVTMLLLLVVAGGVAQSVVSALQAQNRQVQQADSLASARTAFERMTREIRQADPVRNATADRLELGQTRSGERRVNTYTLTSVAGQHRIDHTRALTDVASGATTSSTVPLLSGVRPPAGALFRYFEADGAELLATPMAPIDGRLIRSVMVTVQLSLPDTSVTLDLSTTVTLRNWGV